MTSPVIQGRGFSTNQIFHLKHFEKKNSGHVFSLIRNFISNILTNNSGHIISLSTRTASPCHQGPGKAIDVPCSFLTPVSKPSQNDSFAKARIQVPHESRYCANHSSAMRTKHGWGRRFGQTVVSPNTWRASHRTSLGTSECTLHPILGLRTRFKSSAARLVTTAPSSAPAVCSIGTRKLPLRYSEYRPINERGRQSQFRYGGVFVL